MRIAIASSSVVPEGFTGDNDRLVAALAELGCEGVVERWDDPAVRWDHHDLVVIRTTWDYHLRREEFVEWAEQVGDRLENSPPLVRWNSDKRYLGDLAKAGLPVVKTTYVEPGSDPPAIEGEVVVKPTVSAGGRDTGRFGPGADEAVGDLVRAIHAGGHPAMVQPYQAAVDSVGETAVAMIDGAFSHALHKRAVLRPGEVAPVRDDALGAAEVMYDPGLVTAGEATPAERELAADVVRELERRFGRTPLYARVDMVPGEDSAPTLMELEAIEPNLYHSQAPGSAELLAEAMVRRARRDG